MSHARREKTVRSRRISELTDKRLAYTKTDMKLAFSDKHARAPAIWDKLRPTYPIVVPVIQYSILGVESNSALHEASRSVFFVPVKLIFWLEGQPRSTSIFFRLRTKSFSFIVVESKRGPCFLFVGGIVSRCFVKNLPYVVRRLRLEAIVNAQTSPSRMYQSKHHLFARK